VNQVVDEADAASRRRKYTVGSSPITARGEQIINAHDSAKPPKISPPIITHEAKFFHCTWRLEK
jgi:hypothetical protein